MAFARTFLPIRTFVLALALGLAACGPSHVERMHITGMPLDTSAPTLDHAIAVGEVSGGSSWLNSAGVTDGEFKEVLEYALRNSGVLAPSLAAARWRLNVALDFDPAFRWAFSDQQVDTTITYRLFAQPEGNEVFERIIRTSDTK